MSVVLQATQAALRTHQAEKLEALRNAVLNVAAGKGPSDDMQMVFLSFIDSFRNDTPLALPPFGGDCVPFNENMDQSNCSPNLRSKSFV